ncbi:DNA polymerase I [Bacteroides fragilis]|uniref:DNA polymerase I n=1 Tax=Bacteroides fragilis TaxID=817 RepID=A0A2M9VB54_BACFG|nr:DNA polymerase I [Bacteroides fragilis]EXY29467.1 DNA polymerase I [Bacteroides fragilis str. 3397 T10]EXZ51004.1 DNA polymerase I [Bacteroides fragilis str. 3397 N2]EXZ55812.1 DNA polymerase I [Bacteroides fragilis str. 3397 T14]EXZ65672.1 DNA polymerase I [Bacteroides fragilis str. 3725 D9(v)]EYA45790.1 DNA polymerase I [Bacteroides fragilis str. 3397 N3]
MNQNSKLFLLDAYALIYRAYYAFIKNPRINSKGFNTSAILGFVNTLEEVLKKENPTHIGVAFDPPGPTFRHEAFEQYKAQREETPEAIRLSVPIIKDIIKAYRIPILEVAGYEADDVIGTLATEAGNQGITTYMMTPDKDYGQLVTDHVFMYRPKYGDKEFEVMGVEQVKAKFDIQSPAQVIDMLGLMGDSSDNIPGCPGVGEKTAQKLIAEFGSIENLLEHTDQLKGALKTKVETNREMIIFSKFLATIKVDVPIRLDMNSLVREQADEDTLRKIFEELEFRTLMERIFKKESSPASPIAGTLFNQENGPVQGNLFEEFTPDHTNEEKKSNLESLNSLSYDYQLIDTEEKRNEIIKKLLTSEILALDTETTGTDPMDAELVGMSFSITENQAFYVPVPAERKEAIKIVREFEPVFKNEKSLKVGQNIKYDMLVLQNYGIEVRGKLFDTMVAHYVLQPELRHNMDYLAEIYLHYQTIHIEELIGPKGKGQKNMRDLSPQEVYLYACEDADVTLKLKNILEQELKKNDAEKLFYEIEMPLVPVLVNIESNGVRLDTEALKQSSEHFTTRLQSIEKEIYTLAEGEFNIASPKQVGEILFDKLKIVEKAKKTKTGQYVTSEEVLESLRNKHDIIGKILEYRGLKKLLSTYIDALPQLINPKTGRIHTSFNQTVTATGRLSSSNPNLQNIPIRDEDGKEIRKAFIPDDGCSFFSADYSQIELRIMAHLSEDKNMIDAFLSGYDIHAATAAKIYKVDIKEVTADMRRKAKTANFGIIYGISVFGLAERMNVDRKEAKELIDGYFETYPQVKSYMDKSIQVAREHGYVETIFHRKRFLPDINSRNAVVRGYAERNAINAPIQGSAADIIKVAMARIYERFKAEGLKAKMILQVHDELNFSVPAKEKEIVEQVVIEEMEKAYRMHVPLKADCGWGTNWLEAH